MKARYLFILSLFILSCQPEPLNVDKDIKPILRSNWDSFIEAWQKEDAASCAALYTKDGINIPPSLKINEGREAVKDFYTFLFNANLSSNYKNDIIEVNGNFQDVIEYGQFQVEWTRNDSTTWTYYARTLTHWVNQDGEWKIDKFIFNNPPEEN